MNQEKNLKDTTPLTPEEVTPPQQQDEAISDQKAGYEREDLAHEQVQFKSELGWLGKVWGGKKEKPGNISGLLAFLCFGFLVVAFFFPFESSSDFGYKDMFFGLLSIITLILGYLFGSNDRG